jgi:hypothetical protein
MAGGARLLIADANVLIDFQDAAVEAYREPDVRATCYPSVRLSKGQAPFTPEGLTGPARTAEAHVAGPPPCTWRLTASPQPRSRSPLPCPPSP